MGKDSQSISSRAYSLLHYCGRRFGRDLCCASLLARFGKHSGSLLRAAFLSSRNDVLANIAMIATALLTVYIRSGWPDLVVGLGIAALNADAAREVWIAAQKEHKGSD